MVTQAQIEAYVEEKWGKPRRAQAIGRRGGSVCESACPRDPRAPVTWNPSFAGRMKTQPAYTCAASKKVTVWSTGSLPGRG
jgi:hypothetical protein